MLQHYPACLKLHTFRLIGLRAGLFLFLLYFFVSKVYAQPITITPNNNAQQLLQTIVGAGYNVFNVSMNCPNGASGIFTNNTSNIGLPNGIILTSGGANLCVGPNNNISAGVNNGAGGDAHLDSMANTSTYDACALEFDLVPACDTLKINYVFASEEYPEYVNKPFNDVFGFFIKGPGITGFKNIALIPGTTVPVTINSLNQFTNSQYYVNNLGGSTIQYDGFSKPLVAWVKVNPCDTYHLKLVVADVTDGIYDSGVLIQGNTIECSPVVYTDMASSVTGLENCSNINVNFCRTGDTTQPFVIHYVIGGTAINGVDYQLITDSLVIPANQACAQVPIIPIIDTLTEGQEVITMAYQFGFCPKWDTLKIYMNDPPPFDAGPNVSLCLGDSAHIGNVPAPGMSYSWQPAIGLNNPLLSNPMLQIGNVPGACAPKYVLTGTSLATGCVFKDSLYVTANMPPTANFTINPDYCLNDVVSPVDASTAVAPAIIKEWLWSFGNNMLSDAQAPQVHYTVPGTYTVSLSVKDDKGCKNDTSRIINVWPSPQAHFTYSTACAGDSIRFTNTSTAPNGCVVSQTIWNFGDNSPLVVNSSAQLGHLFPLTSNFYSVQVIVTSDKGCVNSYQSSIYLHPTPKASFTQDNVCVYDKMKFLNQSMCDNSNWNFGDTQTSTLGNPAHLYNNPGTYQVTLVASSNYGCADTLSKMVSVYDIPHFDFLVSDTAGCPYFCTFFKSVRLQPSDPIVSMTWWFGTGDTDADHDSLEYCYKNKGQYSPALTAVTNYGCRDTVQKSLYINVYPLPGAAFNVVNSSDLSVYEPEATFHNISSSDVVYWWWDLGDGTTDIVKTPPPHVYAMPAEYTVTLKVENSYGCRDSVSNIVTIQPGATVYVPNTFTPNDDGNNEYFHPYCSGIYEDCDFVMYIFNRFGQNIFSTKDRSPGWDGYYKGNKCQQGVYVYQMFFYSKEDRSLLAKFKGHVNLIH